MKLQTLIFLAWPLLVSSPNENHTSYPPKRIPPAVECLTLPEPSDEPLESQFQRIEVPPHWKNISIDTLCQYICTQSTQDTMDWNTMAQVMLHRLDASPYNSFTDMLYSDGQWGSGSVYRSNYWWTDRSAKIVPEIRKEVENVLNGKVYKVMPESCIVFSNWKCNSHMRKPDKYRWVDSTEHHRYFSVIKLEEK